MINNVLTEKYFRNLLKKLIFDDKAHINRIFCFKWNTNQDLVRVIWMADLSLKLILPSDYYTTQGTESVIIYA